MAPQKRVSVKIQNPNPLFEKWLTEWYDEAISKGSNTQYCFSKALASLKRYPLPLPSGRSCKMLDGFGDRLCSMLDRKLTEHRRQVGPNVGSEKKERARQQDTPIRQKVPRLSQSYVPAYRSGPYAILITLYEESLKGDYPGYMMKKELIRKAQHLCDHSFSKPDPGSFYTAWSSMKTLLNKSLVSRTGNPVKFSLTEDGAEMAKKLYEQKVRDEKEDAAVTQYQEIDKSSNGLSIACDGNFKEIAVLRQTTQPTSVMDFDKQMLSANFDNSQPSTSKSYPISLPQKTLSARTVSSASTDVSEKLEESVLFAPGSFDVILIVDKQETSGVQRQKDDNAMLCELLNLKTPHEMKHLKVGDYTWVCRERTTRKELVLPYVVERKRVDDFGSSIKDGRFYEQKFRLKQCGLQNLIYLVESYGQNTYTGLPMATLQQGATNTLVQDGFSVKFTDSLRGTAEYLSCLTVILDNMYKNKTLVSCSKSDLHEASKTDEDIAVLMHFNEFNRSSSKNKHLRVKDFFVKQLLQLKGVSVDKALAIVEKYPTPRSLIMAYKENPGSSGEKLLSTIPFGKLRKNIGPAISKTIHQLYTQERFVK